METPTLNQRCIALLQCLLLDWRPVYNVERAAVEQLHDDLVAADQAEHGDAPAPAPHDCERDGCAKGGEDACEQKGERFLCTLVVGHAGDHRACTGSLGGEIVDHWPAAEAATDQICRACGTFRATCACPLDVEPPAPEAPGACCDRCGDDLNDDDTNCCCDDDGSHEDCGHDYERAADDYGHAHGGGES